MQHRAYATSGPGPMAGQARPARARSCPARLAQARPRHTKLCQSEARPQARTRHTKPSQAKPSREATPGKAKLSQAVPDWTRSSHPKPYPAGPKQSQDRTAKPRPRQAIPSRAKPRHTGLGHAEPPQAMPGQAKRYQAKPSQARPGQAILRPISQVRKTLCQAKLDQIMPSRAKRCPTQVGSSQAIQDQSKLCEGRPNQIKAGPGQGKSGKAKSSRCGPYKTKPSQA